MGVETKLHEASSRLGLVGEAMHGIVERSVAVVHIAKMIGHDALELARGHQLVDSSLHIPRHQ